MIGAALALSLAASARDIRERIIPNGLVLALAGCGVVYQLLRALSALPPWMALSRALAAALPTPGICLVAAFLMLDAGAVFEILWRRLRGEQGLGMGDIKFLAAQATFLGPWAVPAFALACLGGGIWAFARRERDFAMAPWITLGCAAVCIWLAAYAGAL